MPIPDSEFKALLTQYQKFSVYGLGNDLDKPSHYVPLYMREHGWKVVGAYPKHHSTSGFKIYPTIADVPEDYRRFVDVFRASERIPQVVDELIAAGGVEVMWLQLGISHPEAEAKAEKAGIKVVSNRCLIVEHRKYF